MLKKVNGISKKFAKSNNRIITTCSIFASISLMDSSGLAEPISGLNMFQATQIYQPKASADRKSFQTSEYYANWGLALHGFDSAYAVGATGQNVTLGQLDSAPYPAHPELAGINFGSVGNFPLTVMPAYDSTYRQPQYHGMHVAGIMVARKDGSGMHGGAYGVTNFLAGTYRDKSLASILSGGDVNLGNSIVAAGADFLNHSYGYNFSNYAYRVTLSDGNIGYRGPSIDNLKFSRNYRHLEQSSSNGVVNVTSAGNDRYYAAFRAPYNKYDARPRLFRGISAANGLGTTPIAIYKNSSVSDETWRATEKGIVNVVILNGTDDINSYSNICGITKYWCMGAAGGMLAEAQHAYKVNLPELPFPVDYYYPDASGKSYIYEKLNGPTLTSDQYRILSLGVVSNAPPGSSQSEIMSPENLKATYRMAMGTSMASPMLASGLAVIKSRFPYLENWQVRDIALTTARDLGAPGIDRVYGWGALDIKAAIGGPRMLFGFRRDYLETLLVYEKEAARKYNGLVAQADFYGTKAYELKIQILENEIAAKKAIEQNNSAEAERLRNINKGLVPQEAAYRKQAYDHELTRDHPNNPLDTPEAAFEYINFVVNIPGEITEKCQSIYCLADAWVNDISGPGGLEKTGKGLLALAGTNSYAGGTTITNGILQIGVGGKSGSVTGTIVNNSSLVFARSNEWVYDGKIVGTGTVTVLGGGTFRLTADNTYSGQTFIYDGALAVDGSITSQALIHQGGILGGNGRVGSLVAHSGAVVSPGNSIGTLTATGDVQFDKGSLFAIEVAPDGKSDRLNVQGKTTLLGGVVSVSTEHQSNPLSPAQTLALLNKSYTILQSGAGVNGKFGAAYPNYYFIGAELSYDPNNVLLTLSRNNVAFADVGQTINQKAAANGLESLGAGNPLYDTMATTTLAENLPAALASLSGEIHASVQGALIEDNRFVRDAAMARIRSAFDRAPAVGQDSPSPETENGNGMAFWGQAYGSWNESDSDGNAASYNRSIGGFVTGFDGSVADDWRLGILAGYSNSSLHAKTGDASASSYQIGLYGGTQIDALILSLGANFAHHEVESDRNAWLGTIRDRNSASYDANSVQLFGEAAYRFTTSYANIDPFAGLAYTHLKTDSFREDGGLTALSGSGQSSDVTVTTLGVRLSHDFALTESTQVSARGMVGWNHAFGDVTPESRLAFAGGDRFTVEGLPIAKDAFAVEAGLDFNIGKATTLGVAYTGRFASGARDNAVKADLTVRF